MAKILMNSQTIRPLLGGLLEISIYSEGDYTDVLNETLDLANSLAKIFNINDPDSEVASVLRQQDDDTVELSVPLGELFSRADEISKLSDGVFGPSQNEDGQWDLTAFAQGYIIDRMVENLLVSHPDLMGSVHIDRNFHFFNIPQETIRLHIGNSGSALTRELSLEMSCIASSDPHSVLMSTVIARDSLTASALTSIGLYAEPEVTERCAVALDAEVFVFTTNGETLHIYNPHENSVLKPKPREDDWSYTG